MVKHITVRFAWHDNKWNGRICKAPRDNIYCVGNYSLLSPRIQRRRVLEIEEEYKNEEISKPINEKSYIPPCYWCINALGNNDYQIEHVHPYEDFDTYRDEFKAMVPHIKDTLNRFSVFTWCFKLSFNKEPSPEKYPPPDELERRLKKYLGEIIPGKSIAFFYANYDNPITGDERNTKTP